MYIKVSKVNIYIVHKSTYAYIYCAIWVQYDFKNHVSQRIIQNYTEKNKTIFFKYICIICISYTNLLTRVYIKLGYGVSNSIFETYIWLTKNKNVYCIWEMRVFFLVLGGFFLFSLLSIDTSLARKGQELKKKKKSKTSKV